MRTSLLIVEDEARLAGAMRALLTAEGFTVYLCKGIATAMEQLGQETVSAAILDVNVADGLVYPVADRLQDAGVPYAFCSSMEPASVPGRHEGVPFLQKPFEFDQLLQLASDLAAEANPSDV